MTIDETYKYLKRIRIIDAKIRYQQLKRAELESCLLPKAIRYDGDRVQSSPADRQSAIAALVLDLDKVIHNLMDQRTELILDTTQAIERLEDDNERLVLMGYYVGCMSMTDVSRLISYSLRRSYEICRDGVDHLSALL